MNDIFNRGLNLFTGIIYESVDTYLTFIHIKSVFTDQWYNFIVPTVGPNQLNWTNVKSIITLEKTHGTSMLYYVPDHLFQQYQLYFSSHEKNQNTSSDYYICKHTDTTYNPIGNFVLVDDSNIDIQINIAKICFPEWANNEQYSRHMYDNQKNNNHLLIRNYLLKHNGIYVGTCGYIGSKELNLSYFHGIGVLPDYRRKGYFTSMIEHLLNVSASLGITDAYVLVENESGSYHGLIKLGFIVKDKYHLFSTST